MALATSFEALGEDFRAMGVLRSDRPLQVLIFSIRSPHEKFPRGPKVPPRRRRDRLERNALIEDGEFARASQELPTAYSSPGSIACF
jgi:hypothetical protein